MIVRVASGSGAVWHDARRGAILSGHMHQPGAPCGASRGFTLIELLLVMLIIGVLASLVIPNYRKSVLRAQAADVMTRIEAINVAIKNYETDFTSVPTGAGPDGAAPDWLKPYLAGTYFTGPGDISFQLTKPDQVSAPILVVTAGGDGEQQTLIAASMVLGSSAALLGGGASLAVTLTN